MWHRLKKILDSDITVFDSDITVFIVLFGGFVCNVWIWGRIVGAW